MVETTILFGLVLIAFVGGALVVASVEEFIAWRREQRRRKALRKWLRDQQ